MTQRYRFFDSVAGDRTYDSAAMSQMLASLSAPDGVMRDYGNGMLVTPNSPAAMNVRVSTGSCFVQGRNLEVYSAPDVLTIAAAHATLNRYDVIVARITFASRLIQLAVLQGSNGASPTVPALTQNATTWEMALAYVYVPATVTSITAAHITDVRNLLGYQLHNNDFYRHWFPLSGAGRVVHVYTDFISLNSTAAMPNGQSVDWGISRNLVASGATIASSADATNGKVDIGSGTGSAAGIVLRTTAPTCRGDLNPRFVTSLIPQAANAAMAIQLWGFFSNATPAAGTGNSKACFRTVTTGNLFAVTGNGTSEQTTDLGVAPSTQKKYEIRSDDDGVTWKFYINDVLVAAHATTIPVASTLMYPTIGIINNTTTAVTITNLDYCMADQDRN